MSVFKFALTFAAVLISLDSVTAQNFFWSQSGFEEGAINGDLIVDQFANPSGTVFLYYQPEGQGITEGIDFDFSISPLSSVEFTAAETFEAEILLGLGGPQLDNRWGDGFRPAFDVAASDITGFAAFNVVNGTGIQPENIPGELTPNGLDFVDTLYDVSANAFLVGSFDYQTRAGNFPSVGLNDVFASGFVGDINVTNHSPFARLQFFGATIPEPGTAGLLTIGLAVVCTGRRRS